MVSTPYLLSIYCWVALEVILVMRDVIRRKSSLRSDRGTRFVVGLCVGVPIVIASALRHWVPALDTLGFGLGAHNWLALLICAVVPMLGMLPRIAVEESEPVRVLGERYRGYQRTTRRLVPGLW